MKILNARTIRDFANQHADARAHLSNWLKETEAANWQSPNDIKAQYATASILPDNRIVFNIKGNSYRLLVHIHYQHRYVTVLRIGNPLGVRQMEALAEPTTSADTTIKSTKAVTSVIKTEEEYDLLLAEFMALVVLDLPANSPQDDRLELLGLLIQDYEGKHFQLDPSWAGDGVDYILYRMDQQALKPKDIIPYLGSRSKVSEVLNRKRPLTLRMIRRLHEGLGMHLDMLIR